LSTAWTVAATPPELEPGHVHVWRARLEGRRDRIALWGYLDDEERRRAQAFYRPAHGERFASARGLLRRQAAAYTGQSPREVRFTAGTYGKPELLASPAPLQFNISHSRDFALLAFARGGRLGVDVEQVRTLSDALPLAERNFAAEEVQWLTSTPPQQQPEVFFRIWTRKEAVLKAVGAGLWIDLHGFSVVPVVGAGELLPMALTAGAEPDPWRWFDLRADTDFQGCLVYDRDVTALTTLEAADS